MRNPRTSVVTLAFLVPASIMALTSLLLLTAPYPSTVASFSDAAPETGNSFNTALWENYVAAADSYIEQDSPTATHGTDTLLTVAAWGAGGGKNNRLLADFDVSGIASGNEILKAELELCATSVPGTSRTYDIHQVNSTWTEAGVTWANQPTVVAGASDSTVIPAAPGCVLWSIVDDVQLWVVGVTNNGVRINDSVEGGSNNETIFRSRENSVTTDRPNLYIVYRTCIDSTAPGAPTGLNAAGTDSLVTLDWNDNGEPDLVGYHVYRSTSAGGPYTKITGFLLTASAYSDTGVSNGTTYYYVVRALDKCANESADSNEDSATPQTGPPEPPTNLTATPGNTEIALDWDDNAEPDLAGYNVYRSTTSGGPYTKVNGPLVTPSAYTDTGLSNGTPYYYVVRAENDSAEESGDSSEATATPVDAPPAPPTGLGATPGDTTVALDWDDNGEPDLAGYNVYRSTTSGGPYSKINGSLVLTSDYADTSLSNGTTYYYVVRAEDTATNESGNSSEVSATPTDAPPAAPTGLVATAGDKEISLNWNDNGESDLDGYNVYRASASGGPYTKVNGALASTSDYTDTGLTGGVTYYYVVRAVDTAAQESGNSNEANQVPYSILIAASDSYVNQQSATTNYGTSATLEVKSKKQGPNQRNERTFAQFDVSSIQPGSTVTSATLTLCATSVPSSRTYDAHRVTTTWTETGVTWNDQPSVAGSATASASTPGSPGCMSWSVTSDVQLWVDGTANYGWRIADSSEGSSQEKLTVYRSSEDSAVPADQPHLQVTWTAP